MKISHHLCKSSFRHCYESIAETQKYKKKSDKKNDLLPKDMAKISIPLVVGYLAG